MADLPEENSEQDVIEDVDFLKKRMEFYSEEGNLHIVQYLYKKLLEPFLQNPG